MALTRSGAPVDGRTSVRRRLRALDACLTAIEDANERGETALPALLAARLASYVPGIRPGMPTGEALDMVFDRQRQAMRDAAPATAISRAEARTLTQRIKAGVETVSLLLLEAHRRRAWAALGYTTWERYVKAEFGLSRTRSYELVYHGEVVREIQDAASMFGIPNLTPYAALQIRGRMDEVRAQLRRRLAGVRTEAEAQAVVTQVIEDMRARARPRVLAGAAIERRVREAVAAFDALPAPAAAAAGLGPLDADAVRRARRAAGWLAEFIAACDARDTGALAG